mmetsp:Transcript_3347/g.3978  ORF Transcript_3347/g.3978 Transcript_3347/m.3978 type:complete len:680 (-) Transcript_3347:75-2114(-)
MKQLSFSVSSLHESALGVGESSKNKVFQIGFYLLSTVGLENVLNTIATKGEDLNSKLSSQIAFSLQKTGRESLLAGKHRKSDERRKLHNNVLRTGTKELSVEVGKRKGKTEQANLHEGIIEFIHKALRFLAEARTCTPQELISRIMFSLAEALAGEPLDGYSQDSLEKAVDEIFKEARQHRGSSLHISVPNDEFFDSHLRAVTGLVVSYSEDVTCEEAKYCAKNVRYKYMHQAIPSAPFYATVQVPKMLSFEDEMIHGKMSVSAKEFRAIKNIEISPEEDIWCGYVSPDEDETEWLEDNDVECRKRTLASQSCTGSSEVPTPCSAGSFPASPPYRNQILRQNDRRTRKRLRRVCEVLRQEKEREIRIRNSKFSPHDKHCDILLRTNGRQIEAKVGRQIQPCLSARCSMPISKSVESTYFEIVVDPSSTADTAECDPNVWVGLSTKSMGLDCITGSLPCSIGFSTSGYIMREAKWSCAVNSSEDRVKVSFGDKIGVCCRWGDYIDIDEKHQVKYRTLFVAFFVNGERICVEMDYGGVSEEDVHGNGQGGNESGDREEDCVSCLEEDEEEKCETDEEADNHSTGAYENDLNERPSWSYSFDDEEEMCALSVPMHVNIFPTVSICSGSSAVTSHFAASEVNNLFDAVTNGQGQSEKLVNYWRECDSFAAGRAVVALDGYRVL